MYKNCLPKTALAMCRPFIQKHPAAQVQNLLVVSTTALGDTLWATPALASLRTSFPDAFIGVLTSSIGMEVLKHNPHIDQLFLLEKLISLQKRLYTQRFDTILLFHASQRFVLPLSASLGATRIIGTAGINKGLDSLLTDPLPQVQEHEILRRLRMVERIGGRISSETLSFFLQPSERVPKKSGRWVALHPGSKDPFKRWPKEHFAEVGRALQQQLGVNLLITGTRAEEELIRNVAATIPGAHVADCTLSLRAFAALLEGMDLLICNDTGPFHLACALNVPALGIYAATNPVLCGPHRAARATLIAKKNVCTPCLKRRCREPFCQLQIGTCEVIDAAVKILS